MSRHSFDPKIAGKVGLNAAVIYQNIVWWCEKNAANGKNMHDGRAWTYNSMKAFETLFPYLTAKQIRSALDKLEEVGLLESGNFNANTYDRTKWYCPVGQVHSPSRANGSAQKGEPIPDSKPVLKPDSKPEPSPDGDLFASFHVENLKGAQKKEAPPPSKPDLFETFWEAYPPGKRKTDKAKARQVFWRIVQGKHKDIPKTPAETIIAGVKRRAGINADPEFLPLPATWLNGERWASGGEPQQQRRSRFDVRPDVPVYR